MSLSFTRKTDYALVALASLAKAGSEVDPQSARDIARRHDLPAAALMNLMKKMHAAGLVASRRGVSGGYWLARPASEISVAEVIEVIEGPVRVAVCCDDDAESRACSACRVKVCPVTQGIHELNGAIVRMLRGVSIQDLAAPRTRLPREPHVTGPASATAPEATETPAAVEGVREKLVQLVTPNA